MKKSNCIKVSNVSKKYGKKNVLENISFELNEGDVVGYLGANGAGKTTTINTILGLNNIHEGTIEINDIDVKNNFNKIDINMSVILDKICLYENMTLYENMLFFGMLSGEDKREIEQRIENISKQFDLDDILHKRVSTFSKGMKRKGDIARGLVNNPKVLIMDEPFDGIDIENRANLIEILKTYIIENKTIVLLTSHIMDDIESIANKIMILKNGKLLVNESMNDFKKRKTNTCNTMTEIYLKLVRSNADEL